jgi:hypothetical protein
LFCSSRKFASALDVLANSLDTPINYHHHHQQQQLLQKDGMHATTMLPNIAAIDIHAINGYGSLIAPMPNTESSAIARDTIEYDTNCVNDQDCYSTSTSMKCQGNRCQCSTRFFWSSTVRRCMSCKDVSIGNRCFRLSSHKSTWYEANESCQDESHNDDQHEYTMKLASSLNRTDIELLKQSLVQDDDGDQLDYFYWLGLTSQFDTKNTRQRTKRRVPTTIFRWYDNGQTASLTMPDIWCSQTEPLGQSSMNNNELCVSLTGCGLYADDCQRNYRFVCEAM